MAKPKNVKRPHKITVSLYIEQQLWRHIVAQAANDRRTISQFVSIVLEKHFGIRNALEEKI